MYLTSKGRICICKEFVFHLPELVRALSGLLDVVMALEPVAVACVAVAAAAKAARFCMAFRPSTQKHAHYVQDSKLVPLTMSVYERSI